MTETYNPFAAVAEPDVPAVEAAKDRRRNLLALGGLAAVLLAGGAYVLSGGDQAVQDVALVPVPVRATVSAPPSPPVVQPPVVNPPVVNPSVVGPPVVGQPQGHNPFKALYVQPAAASATARTTPVVTTTDVPATVAPVVVVAPVPATTTTVAPTTTTPTTTGAPASSLSTISLTRVDSTGAEPVGTFVYDGRTLTGDAGDVLAGKLRVVSLSKTGNGTWYAYLKLGAGRKFEVHKGQTVVVP